MEVDTYLEDRLGEAVKTDDDYRFNCPYCDNGRNLHKMYVSTSQGIYHCFNCGQSGRLAKLVSYVDGINYFQAKNMLESLGLLTYSGYSNTISESDKIMLLFNKTNKVVNKIKYEPAPFVIGYHPLYENLNNKEAIPFFQYCKKRGFSLNQIRDYNIGYVKHGKFKMPDNSFRSLNNSLVFLTYDNNGKYIYWNSRSIVPNKIKSVNAPEFEGCYSKKNCIFNFDQARLENEVVVTEGVPDALSLGKSGVGTFGKQVTTSQVGILLSLPSLSKVFIMLDMDAKDNIISLASKLSLKHKETYIVDNPTNLDANDLGYDKAWDIIHNNSKLVDDYVKMELKIK